MMKTKHWTKPKLIVLFKGRAEEALLQICKSSSRGGAYANNCVNAYNMTCSTSQIS
jgi:hypothetical protein